MLTAAQQQRHSLLRKIQDAKSVVITFKLDPEPKLFMTWEPSVILEKTEGDYWLLMRYRHEGTRASPMGPC